MISLQLWYLFYAVVPRHPLFENGLKTLADIPQKPQGWLGHLRQVLSAIIIFLVMMTLIWVILPVVLLLSMMPVLLSLIGTVNAAFGVAESVAREHAFKRYDLIVVSPSGALGAGWALVARFLRTHYRAVRILRLGRIFHLFILIASLLLVFIAMSALILYQGTNAELVEANLISALLVILVVVVMHIDLMQGIMAGALVGLCVPTVIKRRTDAGLVAGMLALALQLLVYAAALALFSVINQSLWVGILLESPLIAMAILSILLLGLHEAVLYGLWILTTRRLNAAMHPPHTLPHYGFDS